MLSSGGICLVAVPLAPCVVTGRLVTFDNTKPRLDSSGSILKAHDGTTRRFGSGGPFVYHAMGYPACNETGRINGCNYVPNFSSSGAKTCIYGRNNSVLVYSSPDLSSGSWTLEETVYPSADSNYPSCTYFRSQAVYNPSTKKYILWAKCISLPGQRSWLPFFECWVSPISDLQLAL